MEIWTSGGWAMAAIAAVAMVMFALGMHLYLRLLGKGFKVPEQTWRRWIEHPDEREGRVGEFIGFVTACDIREGDGPASTSSARPRPRRFSAT